MSEVLRRLAGSVDAFHQSQNRWNHTSLQHVQINDAICQHTKLQVHIIQCHNKVVFQSKTDHPCMCLFSSAHLTSFFCDLDVDLVTLVYEPQLDILNMCLYTKNELSRSRL